MLAYCFNPQVARNHIQFYCIVFQLASADVNQNEARLKYRFYLQFPTSEFHIFVLFKRCYL